MGMSQNVWPKGLQILVKWKQDDFGFMISKSCWDQTSAQAILKVFCSRGNVWSSSDRKSSERCVTSRPWFPELWTSTRTDMTLIWHHFVHMWYISARYLPTKTPIVGLTGRRHWAIRTAAASRRAHGSRPKSPSPNGPQQRQLPTSDSWVWLGQLARYE